MCVIVALPSFVSSLSARLSWRQEHWQLFASLQLAVLQILRVKRVLLFRTYIISSVRRRYTQRDKRDQRISFFEYQKPTSFEMLTSLGTVEPRRFLRPQWSSLVKGGAFN